VARALARVNLAAIERNTGVLSARLGHASRLCAVVKADGYGHGAVPVARAVLSGGASVLAVATAEEAAELRLGGIGAPILVMGAVGSDELPTALAAGAELVAWDERFVRSVLAAAVDAPIRLHVKLDTGMGRYGTRDPREALRIAQSIIDRAPALELAGVMTHFATADGDQEFVAAQLGAFTPFVRELRRISPGIVAHAANSAATLRTPASHFDMVRCGIAIYGCDPMNEDPARWGLEAALSLHSYVAAVKLARRGDSVGYGRRFVASGDTWIATLPIGYDDGVPLALSNNCDVLIGRRRYPLIGAVSMDNITVDLGERTDIEIGAPATLIGVSGPQSQSAEEIAARIGTINYEVVCWISKRVPREHHWDGAPERRRTGGERADAVGARDAAVRARDGAVGTG
jgi:alanine racemase